MSTPQPIAFPAPRVRFRQTALLTALGVLVAIAVSIAIIALTTGGHPATASSPVTVSQATSGSVPGVHFFGPRQIGAAALDPQSTQRPAVGTTPAGHATTAGLHYTCLGAAERCFR
jgi:hypothetical protein